MLLNPLSAQLFVKLPRNREKASATNAEIRVRTVPQKVLLSGASCSTLAMRDTNSLNGKVTPFTGMREAFPIIFFHPLFVE